jgi:hypothetical protein
MRECEQRLGSYVVRADELIEDFPASGCQVCTQAIPAAPQLTQGVQPLRISWIPELVVVVVSGLNDDQLIIGRAMDEAVLIVDPPGPEAGEVAAQRLRLAGTFEYGSWPRQIEGLVWGEGGGFSCRQSRRSDAGAPTQQFPRGAYPHFGDRAHLSRSCPLGRSGADRLYGALRAMDSSARPRTWAGLRSAPPARQLSPP